MEKQPKKIKLFVNYAEIPAMKLLKREDGASLIEYASIVGLLAVVCIVGMAALGDQMGELLCKPIPYLTDQQYVWIDGQCCDVNDLNCGGIGM